MPTHKPIDDMAQLSLRQLRDRRRRIVRQLPGLEAVIAGSLQDQRRRCGKEGCRCARGELHGPYQYLSVRVGRRTRMLYVPAELADQITAGVAANTAVQAGLADISAINLELFKRGHLA